MVGFEKLWNHNCGSCDVGEGKQAVKRKTRERVPDPTAAHWGPLENFNLSAFEFTY